IPGSLVSGSDVIDDEKRDDRGGVARRKENLHPVRPKAVLRDPAHGVETLDGSVTSRGADARGVSRGCAEAGAGERQAHRISAAARDRTDPCARSGSATGNRTPV